MIAHLKVGDIVFNRRDFADAIIAYHRGMEIATRLTTADPGKTDYQRDLLVSQSRIGVAFRSRGDAEGSLTLLTHVLAISKSLAALAADNLNVQRDVEVDHQHISETLLVMGRRDEAREHARQALAMLRDCATRFPASPQWAADEKAVTDLLHRIDERP